MKVMVATIKKLFLFIVLFSLFFHVYSENKSFKSSPNYIVINSQYFTPPTNQITLECWIKANSLETWAAPFSYLNDNIHNESGFAFTFVNNRLCFMLKTSTMRGDEWNYNPGTKIEIGQWVHLAGTYDGETIKMYKDGVLMETKTTSGPIDWSFKPDAFHIGAFKDFNEKIVFDGEIDEVRIWNTARTSQEIKQHKDQSLNGTEEGLVAYYNFDNDNNTFIKDLSRSNLNGKLSIPSKETILIPSGSMIVPTITQREMLSPSSLSLEWETAESVYTYEHYIVEFSNSSRFNQIFRTEKSTEKKILVEDISGGNVIFARVRGYSKEIGYTAYSPTEQINDFGTALTVLINSIATHDNSTRHKLVDYNILMTDFVGFPSHTKDIQFNLKLVNQNPENITPGKIVITGPSRTYETDFLQSSNITLFNMKTGKYKIYIEWGCVNSSKPLSANLRMEIKPAFFQQVYIQVILVLAFLAVGYLFLRRYRLVSNNKLTELKKQIPEKEDNKDWISPEELEKKAILIKETVAEERLYLDPKFNLKSLAEKIDIPHYHISRILKDYYELNFNDFINEFRVNEFIELLKDKKAKHMKNSALAYQCGFYSESTFFRAFKKFMGKTPQQYQKEIDKNE